MGQKFGKTAITFEGRRLGENPFKLFTTSIYSMKWDMNEWEREVSPRVVSSSEMIRIFFEKSEKNQKGQYFRKLEAIILEMGKVVPVPGPNFFLAGTGTGPAPKIFPNRTVTKICFWTDRVEIFFSPGPRPGSKMIGPAHVYNIPTCWHPMCYWASGYWLLLYV
jgi:hypothetical protein